ncbi:hypothetical protein CAEBREN_18842 [Caenorhabditis brenneri]|uniref:C-type lectin domain-containing protein n=1 Tax=Caenorhabditis brenneri TaxID=135651 RepID=G0NQM2_CAEBE|nr:hypothetical protein CAEBREN_18842 [Caenorhabditis brenneri]
MFKPEGPKCLDVVGHFMVDYDDSHGGEDDENDFFNVENDDTPEAETPVVNAPAASNPVVVSKVETADVACRKMEVGNCEEGWKSFKRPNGEWCMKVFYENWVNQIESEKRCNEQNATLSGFHDQLEKQFVTTTVTDHLYPSTGSVWIGLKRTPNCLNSKLTKNCTTLNSFEWSDKFTKGSDGMLWTWGQPANVGGKQDCAMLTTGYNGYIQYFQTGTFDDVGCDIRYKDTTRGVRGFVCGKQAKH